jgi:hypothetical protein
VYPLKTRETVATETPLCSATSRIPPISTSENVFGTTGKLALRTA